MDIDTEAKIISSCKTDIKEFYKLYDTYVGDVYRFVYSYTKDKHLTEDIVSATFETALKSIIDYELRGISIKSWFFSIARGKLSNYWKSKLSQEIDLSDDLEVKDSEDIAQKSFDRDLLMKVFEFIKSFSPPIPEIFQMRLTDEMSFKEIAEVIGDSEANTKMRYYRAINKIKSNFGMESGL